MLDFTILLLSTALLLAMLFNLVLKPAYTARLTTFAMSIAFVGGLLIYGFGFAEATKDIPLSVIRIPMVVIRMFIGVNELGSIQGTRFVSTRAGLVIFWLLHLMAFYCTASAAMLTLGSHILRYVRLFLSRKGDLILIYGINERSIRLGRECVDKKRGAVVFVADRADDTVISDLNNLSMSVLTGQPAVESAPAIMRALKVTRRQITVYALDERPEQNLTYAMKLRDALEKCGVSPKKTELSLPGAEDILAPLLQVSDSRYGYGYVNIFDPSALTARAMIRLCPPWKQIYFDENGRGEDFSCAIIGFGRHGQEALRHYVMNGQFAGSRFHAAVFSPSFEDESGPLLTECPELFSRYDIQSFTSDGRSRFFYNYVEKHLKDLRVIAVCAGNEALNTRISDSLMLFLKRRSAEHICVLQCSESGVRYQHFVGGPIQTADIYSLEYLSARDADKGAIQLNAVYDTSERSDWEKWVACDSFSKMSSRASADFAPAFLSIAGRDHTSLSDAPWQPEGALLQSLGETEHLRWCAFHFANGYAPMPRDVFIRRLQEQDGTANPAKDTSNRLHACLVSWEELADLSRCTAEYGKESRDYQKNDTDNVLALPRLLTEKEQ